jgi:hypothetical protein
LSGTQEAGKRASDLRHDVATLMKQSNAAATAAMPPRAEPPAVHAPDVYSEAYRLGDSAFEAVHGTLQKVLERLQEAGVTESIAQSSVRQATQISSQAQTVRSVGTMKMHVVKNVPVHALV